MHKGCNSRSYVPLTPGWAFHVGVVIRVETHAMMIDQVLRHEVCPRIQVFQLSLGFQMLLGIVKEPQTELQVRCEVQRSLT
jgi:hypothetical protein